jgi:hypothetical protein
MPAVGIWWRHLNSLLEGLVWFLIEAAVALAVLILIVWWTLPRRRRNGDDNPPQ